MKILNTKACPEVYLIEAFVSNRLPARAEQEEVANHLKLCPRCQAMCSELRHYYEIYNLELKKPVHSSIFKLINEIEKEPVIISGILLHPQKKQGNPSSIHYHSEIVLTTQGFDAVDLEDLDCIPIDDDEIFIRAIQSPSSLRTTLFLLATDEKLYRNIQLQIKPGKERFLSDEIGKIELGSVDINSLDNRNIVVTPENL